MWYSVVFVVGIIIGALYNRTRLKDLTLRNANLRAVSSILIRRERQRRKHEGRSQYKDQADA